ncbi:FkbM family methyltransferase [Methylorubrum extorquens]
MRQNILAKVKFGRLEFYMEMFTNPWGPDDPILDQAISGSFDENLSLAWWYFFTKISPPSSLVLDVGAYAGLFSFVSAKARDDVRVIAFEPSAVTWGRLVRNLHLNLMDAQILAANVAAWDKDEWVSFKHPYGIYTMCPGESALGNATMDHSSSSRAVKLDQILDDRDNRPDYINSAGMDVLPVRHVAAIKIDVEGVETNVIRGAQRVIGTYRPFMICEALNEDARVQLLNSLAPFKYRSIHLPDERNVIFIPEEKYDEIVKQYDTWNRAEFSEVKLLAVPFLNYCLS